MQTVTLIPAISAEPLSTKLRCAAYCRVSSDSTDQVNSFNAQVRHYSEALGKSDTEILADIYADEGITGTRADKRFEFQRMMKDCRKGKIDRIYTKSISRFSRNTKDCLKAVRELRALGISIFFEKENIDTLRTNDELIISIMGGLAQEESISISNNLRWSIQKRMKDGKFNPPSLPFGYIREGGVISIDQNQAELVYEIYSKYLSGYGMEAIALELNRNNIDKDDKGLIWCKNTIKYILTNEKYTGRSRFCKYYTTSCFPFKQKENKGELPQYLVEDTMPQIISDDIFTKVQKIFASRKMFSDCKHSRTYPLSGKITCGKCGGKYKRKVINKKTYWCCEKHLTSASLCSGINIPEEAIYSAFINMFNKLKMCYKQILVPLADSLNELRIKKTDGNKRVLDIYKETANLRDQLHVIARLKTKGFLSDEKYLKQSSEIESKITKYKNELMKISTADEDNDKFTQLNTLISYLSKYENIMKDFDAEAFAMTVDSVYISLNKRLTFHITGGLELNEII